MRAAILVVGLTLLAGPAAAASVSGDLRFDEGVALRGVLDVRAAQGALDLAPGVLRGDDITLTWSVAHGRAFHSTREYVLGQAPQDDVRTSEAFAWGEGSLANLTCGTGCRVFLYARPEGEVGISGAVDGALRRVAREHAYWTGAPWPGAEHAFRYEVGPSWLNISSRATGPDAPTLLQDATPRASGALGLLLWNASGDLEEGGRRGEVRTGTTRSPDGPLGVRERSVMRSIVVELEGARLVAPQGTAAVLLAPTAEVALDGALRARSATGALVVDGTRHALDGEALRVEGDLDLAPRFEPPGLADALAPGPRAARSLLEGTATLVLVGDATLAAAKPASVAPAAGALVLVVLATLLLWLKAGGAASLYTRLERSRLFANPNRRAVYDVVRGEPGTHVREIARRTGLAQGVVRHHLRKLAAHGFLVEREDGRQHAFFAVEGRADPALQEVVLALKDGTRRGLAVHIAAAADPPSQQQLAERLGISPRLASYHLARLEGAGLVTSTGSMPRRYAASARLSDYVQGLTRR